MNLLQLLLITEDALDTPPLSAIEKWLVDEIKAAPDDDYRVWLIEVFCRIRHHASRWA